MEFAEYVARQRPALLRFATVLTCRTWLAEDLVSDVLGRAYERWERISGMAEPNAYVRRMVVNEYLSWRRRLTRTSPRAEVEPMVISDGADERAERDAMIRRLAGLPRKQRAAVVLRYYAGLWRRLRARSADMPRKKATRAPRGRSSIYFGADGYWHGRVTMGVKDNGKPDRRHIMRKGDTSYDDVVEAVGQLEREREEGTVRAPGSKSQTVADWLTHWLENIAAPNIRYKTEEGYRTDINKHLIPRIGAHKMAKIQHEPERFEKVYVDLAAKGYSQYTVHHVHITVRAAFREAKKRKVITENPFEIVKAPRVDEEEVEPFEVEEIQALLAAALERRNGVRFVLALAIGTRKGETIGFRWSWLNKKTKVLRVRKQRQRQTYRHGCSDPAACAAGHHKVKPCRAHKKQCPPPCPPDCTKHAMYCPQRIGGVVDVDVKSRAGRRGIRLPDQLFDLLMQHEVKQTEERELAGGLWHESDFMFTQPNGKPIDPRSDHDEWKALLTDADVRDARLHDARHTAATVLLLLGVPLPAVMEIMGWSNSKVAKRYSHVTVAIQTGIASQVNTLLWGST